MVVASDYLVKEEGSKKTWHVPLSPAKLQYTKDIAADQEIQLRAMQFKLASGEGLNGEHSSIQVRRGPRGTPTPTLLENTKPERLLFDQEHTDKNW